MELRDEGAGIHGFRQPHHEHNCQTSVHKRLEGGKSQTRLLSMHSKIGQRLYMFLKGLLTSKNSKVFVPFVKGSNPVPVQFDWLRN